MTTPIIYIASSVTNASPELDTFVLKFKQELRNMTSSIVLDWIGKDSSAVVDDFYVRNLNNVRGCDAMIAIVDEPSIGIGIEIGEAISLRKPTLCLYADGRSVSRLLLAMCKSTGMPIHSYKTVHDAVNLAVDFIDASTIERRPVASGSMDSK